MNAADFRKLALSLPEVVEGAHMGHPDFRVGGKIFATLGYPDAKFGTVMISPQDQDLLLRRHPKAFAPAAGAWGRAGSTSVRLSAAPSRAVKLALESAWSRRAPKKLRRARALVADGSRE
jgi:hypothetical protein